MALRKFPLLGLLLVLTIVVSSATADGHVSPPSTKLSRRCNNDKGNVVVSFFHRSKVITKLEANAKRACFARESATTFSALGIETQLKLEKNKHKMRMS
ncbi:hypothetical protein ISN45_Aa08g009780 [Arabidopsis thaliana x Arabidopsis arenosa]|uniref:Uncharacterized protein n=1 Tax=Arabidopsis thaliana x Arabidopsis arenosa TaxID=1240361 RepID=A0A8T1XFM5_9BRAS|nr:hypothetical protein ISN45_Aa08g009780 [Arabidopsis thaliana x Arabidopsis arenosa]